MKLIEQSHKIWGIVPTEFDKAIEWIEKAGRTCYDSLDKIKPGSAYKFVSHIIERGHLSVVEHSDIRFPKSFVRWRKSIKIQHLRYLNEGSNCFYANARAWLEFLYPDDISIENLKLLYEGQTYKGKSVLDKPHPDPMITVEIVTNRAMLAELTRHRPASFSVRSQRYCRDSDGVIFIKPVWYDEASLEARIDFETALRVSEEMYLDLLRRGHSPQEARNVLPNAAMTKIVMSTRLSHWAWIFSLRCSPAADPQMRALMLPIEAEFKEIFGGGFNGSSA